jgi:hypothetical protein
MATLESERQKGYGSAILNEICRKVILIFFSSIELVIYLQNTGDGRQGNSSLKCNVKQHCNATSSMKHVYVETHFIQTGDIL